MTIRYGLKISAVVTVHSFLGGCPVPISLALLGPHLTVLGRGSTGGTCGSVQVDCACRRELETHAHNQVCVHVCVCSVREKKETRLFSIILDIVITEFYAECQI